MKTSNAFRAIALGAITATGLYALMVVVAEPMRSRGATATETALVQVTIAEGITITCDDSVNLGTINQYGDTGVYSANKDIRCVIRTNDSDGYNLAWRVTTGSGGVGTGYMISQFEDRISPLNSGYTLRVIDTGLEGRALWAGRLSSTSSGHSASPLSWGADGATGSELWLGVASGASVTIARRNTETSSGGAVENIGFRVKVGSSVIQPTGNYQVIVNFTSTSQ